jgi:archaeosortase C (PEF-CTERM variant)
MFVGGLIVTADVIYNVLTSSKLGPLDIMVLLLGISLIAYSANNAEIRRMGKFGTYMSATFIAFFIIFFSVFDYLNIEITHLLVIFLIVLVALLYMLDKLGRL